MADDFDKSAAPEEPLEGQRRFGLRRIVKLLRDSKNQQRLIRFSAFVGVTSAIAALVVGVSHMVLYSRTPDGPQISLSDALTALDAGNMNQARDLAAALRRQKSSPAEELGGPAYVLGVAMYYDAERRKTLNPREARALYLLAARYFEEATREGFPPGREGQGRFLLGSSRFSAGQYAESLTPLTDALEKFPEQRSEIHRLLAQAYLLDSTPQLAQGLTHIQEFLNDDGLDDDVREESLLTAAEIQFQLADFEACLGTLDQVPEGSKSSAEALLIRGRIRMQQGDDKNLDRSVEGAESAKESYLAARALFEASEHLNPTEMERKARYLLGLIAIRLGDNELAESEFSHTRHSNYDTAEGLAAGFEEAEVMRALGKDDEAIRAYGRVLRQALDMPVYSNSWISLDELARRAEQAYKDYFADGDFAHAIQMANALVPISSPENSVAMQAEAYRAQASDLQESANKQLAAEAAVLDVEATVSWRKAAALYEQLARLRFATRQYPETIWQAAESYLSGHDYRRAVRLLKVFLANEIRRRHPPALTALGEAELAQGEPAKALEALNECIQSFPTDPHSYRARLLAAEANRELGNQARAKELLSENLENEGLVPSSVEWRESLYALGKIYFLEGLGHETASRLQGVDDPVPANRKKGFKELETAHDAFQHVLLHLSEAVQRDQLRQRDRFAAQTLEARYLIAESYRHAAKLPLRKIGSVSIETTRNQLSVQIQQALSAAAAGYQELQKLLNQKQSESELSRQEASMLRNTYFSHADVLYDLEKYREAIQAYATATNRFQNEPESLEAYVQIANCHRQLNQFSEARGTLEQAKVVLNRIRPDADFKRTTRYKREEWEELLDWLVTL